jgi:hypothetical protein
VGRKLFRILRFERRFLPFGFLVQQRVFIRQLLLGFEQRLVKLLGGRRSPDAALGR